MRDRTPLSAIPIGLALAVLLAACTASTASTTGSAQPSGAPGADVAITSQDLKFDVTTLTVPAGVRFTLQLTNLEAAPHNVAIYRDSSASDGLFVGDVISSSSIVYQVPALEAGSYFFRCDVHPDMNGTLVAG
jgi:plastocyanin